MHCRTSDLFRCALAAFTAIAVASCASGQAPQPHTASQTPASAPATSAPATSPPASATPASCPGGWQSGPLTVTRNVSVPPVPVAVDVRTGTHPDCRFDRLVIDFSGKVPGYAVGFVPKVIQDASGKTVTVPGTTFLVIKLSPAQAHSASGQPTLPTTVQALSFQMLKGYVVSGDFEGNLSIALGLAGGTKYRVGELPGRVYIDVAW